MSKSSTDTVGLGPRALPTPQSKIRQGSRRATKTLDYWMPMSAASQWSCITGSVPGLMASRHRGPWG